MLTDWLNEERLECGGERESLSMSAGVLYACKGAQTGQREREREKERDKEREMEKEGERERERERDIECVQNFYFYF